MLKLSKHYPNPENLVTDLITGVTLTNSLLNLAEHGQERSAQALAGNLMNEAAAFSEYAGRALYHASAAAERTMALLTLHDHSKCISDDCSTRQHDRATSQMQHRATSLQDAISLNAVELSYRNRRTPLLEDQVRDDAVFLQQEVRLHEAIRLAALLSDRSVTRNWDEPTLIAHAIACEYLYMAPSHDSEEWQEPPEHDEEGAPEDRAIRQDFRDRGNMARRQMREAIEPLLNRCAESMTTKFSPQLVNNPRMTRWYAQSPKWLSVSEPGIIFDPQTLLALRSTQKTFLQASGPDRRSITQHPPMDPDHDTLILFVTFVHNGVRVIKAIEDPYPKGYPKEQASFHLTQCSYIVGQMSNNPKFPEIASAYLQSLLDTAGQILERDMHDVTPADTARLFELLDEDNVPRGLIAKTFNAIADDDRNQATNLVSKADRNRRRTATPDQAQALIAHARDLQMDEAALEALTLAMGYLPEDMNLTSPGLPEPTYTNLTRRASKLGLPQSLLSNLSYRLEP